MLEKYTYKKDDLVRLTKQQLVCYDTMGKPFVLKKGTLVYINELDKDFGLTNSQINVSEVNSDLDFWINADDTELVERSN